MKRHIAAVKRPVPLGSQLPDEMKASLHAEVAALARVNRIRTLAWCGPVLDRYGLAMPFVETDAVILVDPASTTHLIAALRDAGWEIYRDPADEKNVLPPTRAVLRHPERLIGLEVFYLLPGLFADPEVAFDLLWERGVDIEMAGSPVPSLDRSMGIISVAVHCAGRIPRAPASRDGFHFILDQIEGALSPAEIDDLVSLIRALKGETSMAPLLEGLGRASLGAGPLPAAYARWRLKVDEANPTLCALLDLVEAPVGQRLGRARAGLRELLFHPLALVGAINTVRGVRSRLRESHPADPRGSGWADGPTRATADAERGPASSATALPALSWARLTHRPAGGRRGRSAA